MRKLLPWIFAVGVLAVVYFSFEWAVGAAIHNRQVVMVPDITGKSVSDALFAVSALHLGLSKDGEQFDKSFPVGTVIHQNPPKGMAVREGRIVRVTVSQGGESLFAPNLVGQPLRVAQTMLQNASLNMGEIDRKPSLRFDKDVVMATDPAAGQSVTKNALINLVVSGGQPEADVILTPDFNGKNVSEAKNWSSAHQIPLVTREEADPTKGQGDILNQAPAADTPIRLGETLTVVVNSATGTGGGPHVRYTLPEGTSDRDVKILLVDESGEHEVFRKAQPAGSQVDIAVTAKGRARARIFVNGIQMEEQQIQ